MVGKESALVRWAPLELFVWLAEQIVDLESAKNRGAGLHQRGVPTVPVHVETSVSTAKKGGQGSGMWRSGHGQSGGYCSSGKSDESNTGVPTCPFPSRTRRDYRQDGKRLLEAWTSKGTGGMHCVGVGRRSYGAPASRRSCSQEGGSLPVSPRITATRRTRGPAKDGCTSWFRWTGGGGGRAERSSTGQKNDLWTVCG